MDNKKSNKEIHNETIDTMLDIIENMSEEDINNFADKLPPPGKLSLSEGEGVVEKKRVENIPKRCGFASRS